MAKIMFLGPSGIGKTTLAKFVEKEYGIPFISGSYSDLLPSTRREKHVDMLQKDKIILYSEEHQLLTLRAKKFGGSGSFVSDRSYVDNLTYFMLKLSQNVKQCDTTAFRDNCIQLLDRDCTHLIYVPYTDDMIGVWEVEDNDKRVTNIFYQWQVSQIMNGLLRYLGYTRSWLYRILFRINSGVMYPRCAISGNNQCKLHNHRPIKVLVLDSSDRGKRENDIRRFLWGVK